MICRATSTSTSNSITSSHGDQPLHEKPGTSLLAVVFALFAALLGCNVSALVPAQASPPVPTRIPLPTFTATPNTIAGVQIVITPPQGQTPGVIIIPEGANPADLLPPLVTQPAALPQGEITPGVPTLDPAIVQPPTEVITPTDTPSETPTATFTPTNTDTPTWTPTPTLTPTPFVISDQDQVALLSGPGVEWPLVAILGPGVAVPVVGKNTEGTWLQLCCVNGGSVWVAARNVRLQNDAVNSPLITGGTPPSPTPTFTPTETGTATPTATATPNLFAKTLGPDFFPTNNTDLLTIWAKVYVGSFTPVTASGCIEPGEPIPANKEVAAEGYFLQVTFNGSPRPGTNDLKPSTGGIYFDCSAPKGAGNRIEYNIKYEYRVPDRIDGTPIPIQSKCDYFGNGTWAVTVVDGAGNQLSDPVTFTTQGCSNAFREVYIAWLRTR